MTTASLLLVCTLVADAPRVDFDTQVMPIFTKAGCNAGACHGAAVGRGGFKLSLYGGDPAADYQAIVHQLEGRRINLARPRSSLLLAKPTGRMEHGGEERLEADGPGAKLIEAWIRGGAPRHKARRLIGFEVKPRRKVIEKLGHVLPLRAMARFDDGSQSDVTAQTVFTAADAAAVKIDEFTADAKLLRRGQNIIIARYLDRVVPLQLIVPLSEKPVDLSLEPRHDFIDEHVLESLSTLRLPVSPAADDATFLRRIRLDLTGRLPTPNEVREFTEDRKADDKHQRLVERLLRSPDFVEYWTYKLAKLLRIRAQPRETQGALAFHRWVSDQLTRGAGYDAIARTLLLATGDTHEYGPANFYRVAAGPREQAEYVSELFMGARLRCANCHNHPLDRWTQDDYHGLAAVFARIERGRNVKLGRRGEVTHPRTGEAAVPRIPGTRFLPPEGDGRAALAAWLTSKDNPHFARAIVNRLWKALMGRGLIEPADDLRATNPATHPELLDKLAADFIQHGYDIRHTLRMIATSGAYARSSQPTSGNQADDRFYSHALSRPLEAEVLADALCDVTGVPEEYGGQPAGTRAIALFHPDIRSEALDVLGRCDRRDTCETTGPVAGGLTKKLHLINGPLINGKITSPQGRLRRLVKAGKSNEQIVDNFYLRALGRLPRDPERRHWLKSLKAGHDDASRRQLLEDFVWSLLNCREFTTNH